MSISDLENIIERWKDQYPRGYIPVEREDRILAFLDVIQTLVDKGWDKDDINSAPVKGLLVNAAHNPEYRKTKERATWKDMVSKHLLAAFGRHPLWEKDFATSKFDPTTSGHVDKEYVPYVPPVRNNPVESIQNNLNAPVVEHNDTSIEEQEFDRSASDANDYSNTGWEKVETPAPVYDEDLRILLGFKK